MPFFNTGHLLEILIILAVVLIIFGPKRLPELGSSLGRALREFRQATTEFREQVSDSGNERTASTTTSTSAEPTEAKAQAEAQK